MELDDDNILRFWQWFVKNENVIKDCIKNENSKQQDYVVEQMNEFVLRFGAFSWDIGLDDKDHWFLTISPNGNKDMFEISQKIIELAPEHLDWLFYASKPSKKWDRKFTIYDINMDEKDIDASEWTYLLFDDDDGMLELVIEAKNLDLFELEIAESAVEQFLIHEIGEALRIQLISSIIIVHAIDSEYEDSIYSISELKEHLLEG